MSKNSNISSTPARKNPGGGDLDLSHPDRAIDRAIAGAQSSSTPLEDLTRSQSKYLPHHILHT